MHSSTILAITLAAAGAQASLHKRLANQTLEQVGDYLSEVCLGFDSESDESEPDLSVPCYAVAYIEQECLFGSAAAQQMYNSSSNSSVYGNDDTVSSPRDQQSCIGQSQYFDQLDGCYDCFDKHGLLKFLDDPNDLPAPSAISSFSSSYCQATNTATLGIDDALESAFPVATSSYPTGKYSYSSDVLPTYSFTDPIGNKTDVSLYFTPSVTGTAAYVFSQASPTGGSSSRGHLVPGSSTLAVSSPTASGSSSAQTTTFATNSAGQIVATAGQSSAASSSVRSGAAVATAAADKFALAGVFGMAAVVAYL